jgi:AbrB family looped-hinge helix DNA binding protein
MGAKGQVVIPKELRKALDLEPGDEITFWREQDHVSLRRARVQRPLRGRFAGLDVDLVAELEAARRLDRAREDRSR